MTPEEAERIRYRSCLRKVKYGQRTAQAIAAKRRGEGIRAYRCVFDSSHWHVGHVMGMKSLTDVAMAIRVLAQDTSTK